MAGKLAGGSIVMLVTLCFYSLIVAAKREDERLEQLHSYLD